MLRVGGFCNVRYDSFFYVVDVAEAPSHPPIAAFVELSAQVAAAQAAVEAAEVAIHENSGQSGGRKRKPAQHKMDF